MAGLGGGADLAFPLGGEESPIPIYEPWITNLLPQPDAADASLLLPVQLSMRDVETTVDLGTIHIGLGYTKAFAHGDDIFDRAIDRTFRSTISYDPAESEPGISLTSNGVRVEKTSDRPQRSVYFTALDTAGRIAPSALMSIRMQPEFQNIVPAEFGPLYPGVFPGIIPSPMGDGGSLAQKAAVVGLELGPRNTGVYCYFVNVGTPSSPLHGIRVTGPEVDGVCVPDDLFLFDWASMRRYFLFWNEAAVEFELFTEYNNRTLKLYSKPLADFQIYGGLLHTPRKGGQLDVVGIYGQEGRSGNRVTIRSVAVAVDAGTPVMGGMRLGSYRTTQHSAELVTLTGIEDPRHPGISPWFEAPDSIVSSPDPTAVHQLVRSGAFRISKNPVADLHHVPATSAALYRYEPGLFRSPIDGFLLEAKLFATGLALNGSAAGMGFLVSDGTTVFDLSLFDDSHIKTIGLLKAGGDPTNLAQAYTPSRNIDWSAPVSFRFTVDQARNKLELYDQSDLVTPAMSLPLGTRTWLPSVADYHLAGQLPMLIFGHQRPIATAGFFDLYQLRYSPLYQAWEARTENDPAAGLPPFTFDGGGTPTPGSPLVITTLAGQLARYYRSAYFDGDRGISLEFSCRVTSHKPNSRTGVYTLIDDGVHAYMLSFVDTSSGKFVCLSQRAELDEFTENPGFEGLASRLSFPFDWTQFHTYRFDRRPLDGTYVYVDQEETPRLALSDREYVGWPLTRFPVPGARIGFGHYDKLGAVSEWRFLRARCSTGFEFAIRKNVSDEQLREDLFGAEAIVVAHCTDKD